MSRTCIALLAVVTLMSVGCEYPPFDQQEADFEGLVTLHFTNENSDASLRRANLRQEIRDRTNNPLLPPPSGTVVSEYTFNVDGYIIVGAECPNCKTKHTFEYNGDQEYCPTCGGMKEINKEKDQWVLLVEKNLTPQDLKTRGYDARPMFEILERDQHAAKKDPPPEGPFKANVRYLRRTTVFDDRGMVNAPQKAIDSSGSDISQFPGQGDKPVGFHRPEEHFLGEMVIEYQGGQLIKKSMADETPVRPWKRLRPTRSK